MGENSPSSVAGRGEAGTVSGKDTSYRARWIGEGAAGIMAGKLSPQRRIFMVVKVFDPADPTTWVNPGPPMTMIVDDLSPEELAAFHAQRERYERNLAWLLPRLAEIHAQHKGKCICVAGQELFVADTTQEVIALAHAAHPEDDGRLLRYLSPVKGLRIHAH
jgi:hypothetical protein